MKYLLDLDTVSALSEPTSPYHETAKHNVKCLLKEDKIYLSILSIYELRYSISNTKIQEKKDDILQLIQWCKKIFEILLKNQTGMNRKAITKAQY